MIASPVNRKPGDRHRWVGPAIGIAVILALLSATYLYSLHMPGKTHTGPLPPLTAEEAVIRDRLSGHVWTLAMRVALPSNENKPTKKLRRAVAETAGTADATVSGSLPEPATESTAAPWARITGLK